jgi:hypothetical protein
MQELTNSIKRPNPFSIQDGDWDTVTDLLSSVNQGLSERLETHVAEVKHKGELKHQHSELLACGSLFHTIIY